MARYDSLDLIAQVKRIESIPTSQQTFTDADICELMNMELQSAITPMISSVREEYFVVTQDFALPASTFELQIPSESIGLRLRDVYWIDASGNFSNIPRLQPETISSYNTTFGPTNAVTGFYLQGNTVQFYPKQSATSRNIRMSFHKRPNYLVLPSACATVVAINVGANLVSFTTVPPTWQAGTKLDAISGGSPFEFVKDQLAPNPDYGSTPSLINFAITAVSGSDLVLPTNVVSQLSVGDTLALHGESCFPQYIPIEAYHILVQGTAMRCLEALGDREGYKNAAAKYQTMVNGLMTLINPRVEGEPKKIVNPNSIFNSSKIRSYAGWW